MLLLVEKTKLYDKIYKAYNIKIHQLMNSVKELGLDEDAGVMGLKAAVAQK
jgi:hypothetical protein